MENSDRGSEFSPSSYLTDTGFKSLSCVDMEEPLLLQRQSACTEPEYCLALTRADKPEERPIFNLPWSIRLKMTEVIVHSLLEDEQYDAQDNDLEDIIHIMHQLLSVSSNMSESHKQRVVDLFEKSNLQSQQLFHQQLGYRAVLAGSSGDGNNDQDTRLLLGRIPSSNTKLIDRFARVSDTPRDKCSKEDAVKTHQSLGDSSMKKDLVKRRTFGMAKKGAGLTVHEDKFSPTVKIEGLGLKCIGGLDNQPCVSEQKCKSNPVVQRTQMKEQFNKTIEIRDQSLSYKDDELNSHMDWVQLDINQNSHPRIMLETNHEVNVSTSRTLLDVEDVYEKNVILNARLNEIGETQDVKTADEHYHVTLLESLSVHFMGSGMNCFLMGSCGRKVGVPTFLLGSIWPGFQRMLSTMSCCELSSPLAISFGNIRVETLEVMKDLLLFGKVENPDISIEDEFYSLVADLGLNWKITKEVIDCAILEEILTSQDSEDAYQVLGDRGEGISEDPPQQGVDAGKNEKFISVDDVLSESFELSDTCSKLCSKQCSQIVRGWSEEKVVYFKTMFKADKATKIRQILTDHLKSQSLTGITTSNFCMDGHVFCPLFFAQFIGRSKFIVDSVLKNFSQGIWTVFHGNQGLLKFTPSTTQAICWIKNFSEAYGQYSPEQNVIVLSHWLNKASLFQMYLKESIKPHVSQSQFYNLFKNSFGPNRNDKTLPWVRISKYSTHSVCNICVALNNHHKQCKTETEINQVVALKNNHRLIFGQARRKVNEIILTAQNFPEEHLCIQIDGMDNSKSYLPRYLQKSKDQIQKERIPTKITGCIVYSGWFQAKRKCIFYMNHDQYENGSNLIVTIIYHLLQDFIQDLLKLPKKLHLNLGQF